MKIALIGYGKMGKTLEKLSGAHEAEVVAIVDERSKQSLKDLKSIAVDAAIEFTQPESAVHNIKTCIDLGIPVVSGTTGWLDHWQEVTGYCKEHTGAFFYAANFSIGVNLFFLISEYVADLMSEHTEYEVSVAETHHTEKKDAPSGTAITLAEGILPRYHDLSKWVLAKADHAKQGELPISAYREAEVPGTHEILYKSDIDDIKLIHTAYSREGFATGALIAARWLIGKKGIFGMKDLLNKK